MELIDRYLQSVKWMLPLKQRDDVIRELSDEILSQVEEKETALGRPLTEDEQVALLKQLGHPCCWPPATASSAISSIPRSSRFTGWSCAWCWSSSS